ncbi:uncharacterized protein LOC134194293 isoform X2 [Corticium candelabrum]|uniref:uncharacterized protein LOC134194293 isoform X2 n=1 Tax=Corticium candelabrum TaxID=121492 RepID=UPI002E26EFB4|nr:uncharacterized protein LOC134194293 isoform X2 [Corticium candelabrum]
MRVHVRCPRLFSAHLIRSKIMSLCSYCQGTLESDSAGCDSFNVCTKCGVVLESSDCGLSLEKNGEGSFVHRNEWGCQQAGRKNVCYGAEMKRERLKYSWVKKLRDMAKCVTIPDDVLESAEALFNQAYDLPSTRYRRGILIPSCIYAASRLSKTPLMLKQLAECCYKTVPQIGRAFKLLAAELELTFPDMISHTELVESVCCQVGIPDEIQSDVVSTAKRLCRLLDEIGISDHKGANVLAGVSVAIAWQAKKGHKQKKIPELQRFVRVCHTHSTTFGKTCFEVKGILIQLCRHLPWITGDVKEDRVLLHLHKILDFQKILISKLTHELRTEHDESDVAVRSDGEMRANCADRDADGVRDRERRSGCMETHCSVNAAKSSRCTDNAVFFSEDDLRCDLDERDIPDGDMIQYIRTDNEIVRTVDDESDTSDSQDECAPT